MMNEKMAIVNELVACGYCLMNRTDEAKAAFIMLAAEKN